MNVIDFITWLLFMILGAWKMKELIDVYFPKAVQWVIDKVENRK